MNNLIIVHDNQSDWQAVYRNGELVDYDIILMARDVVDAAQGNPVSLSFVSVEITEDFGSGNLFPDRFETLLHLIAEEYTTTGAEND